MTTAQQTWLGELQSFVTNALEIEALRGRRLAGILGDVPSTYAKSPALWNAAFRALDLPATYVPLDVPQGRLPRVAQALRAGEPFLGGSVTVPYKQAIIPLLDAVDPLAARIGAVNVIVRTREGRLVGYNTDGLGGVAALSAQPGLGDLSRLRILLLGAGGAAQALAFFLWERMTRGELAIANRTPEGAAALSQRLSAMRAGRVEAIGEAQAAERAARMDVIINATVKGQAGVRKLPDGRWTCLEPYSSLGPAEPAALQAPAAGQEPGFFGAWFRASLEDIRRNHEASLSVCGSLQPAALCYDIVYAPLETVFLRHARWGGRRTLNGVAMNIGQAVEAFTRFVCREWLAELGLSTSDGHERVRKAMAGAWGT